jgi:hypothetical protein
MLDHKNMALSTTTNLMKMIKLNAIKLNDLIF